MEIKINYKTSIGTIGTKVENCTSYSLGGKTVSFAEYVMSDKSVTFLEHGNNLELLDTHDTINAAKIHAKQIIATYKGLEGEKFNA